MFLQWHPAPVLIDEGQYAPELFSEIKRSIDKRKRPGAFWLTGSQPFQLMALALGVAGGTGGDNPHDLAFTA
jgi:hypothetical protein